MTVETLMLRRSEIQPLLTMDDYIDTVERAFRLYAEGQTMPPGLLHFDATGGEFHLKAGGLTMERPYFGLKANGAFFDNVATRGLPFIQGMILLCDAENGSPLAVMDSGFITVKRTGAATAVAAKYLAKENARTVTICGCGTQGRVQLEALTRVLPVERVLAYSRSAARASEYAREVGEQLALVVEPVSDVAAAAASSDVIVTCTPARRPFLLDGDVPAGALVAGVGADSPDKNELEPELLARALVVADVLEQCVHVGDLHHAIARGLMTANDVYAQLGDLIVGRKPGRIAPDQTFVFDSTGTALQDVAVAAVVYERARAQGLGTAVSLAS